MMKNNPIIIVVILVLTAAVRPGPSWGATGFGAGQSLDPGQVLAQARSGEVAAVRGAPVPAWLRYIHAPAALRATACPQVDPVVVGGTQGYAAGLGSGLCFVSIVPTDVPGMVYRSYALFSHGLLMVFSSYGEGEGPDKTSAREFYFFPRRGVPQLAMDAQAGTVSVRLGDGGRADFAPASAQLSGLERGTVTV
ncbi:MAG: hypothetical protein PHU21_08935, partial [Elusimicrobia bacterium]|nr:hypothetical protein [Elusimicrobiota bacterium]